MTDRGNTYKTLDLALRIGEMLLSSGAGAADVTATMLTVTQACGVRRVSADLTFTELTLRHQPSIEEPAAIQTRRLNRREIDYQHLTLVDKLVADLASGTITRDEAREQVAKIVSSGHQRNRWAVTLGFGVMGAGLALTLGGGPVVSGLAFLAAAAIDRLQHVMVPRRIPSFYQQAACGLLATLVAVGAVALHLQVDPSRVVTACIIMLLAGIGFMGAMQDALTGFPLTAGARLLDAVLATTGVIAGVSGGLTVGALFGVDLGDLVPGATAWSQASVIVAGAAVAAAAFAWANYAPLRSLLAVAVVAALGQAVSLAVERLALGSTWAAAAAAVTIGAACYTAAGRIRVPPLVVVVPAVVPLLPGLAIYQGLALLAQNQDGVLAIAAAGATAIALASGVILGQYLSQPLRREARWLETRLSGPRMIGPLRRPRRR